MGVYSKDNAGNIKQIAGNIVQRLNTRWFLCTRSIENDIEYYTVPASAQNYFKTIDSYTLYSFGFNEPNTTQHPILRYGNIELDILDFTTDDGIIVPGQLMGVFQMFTQDLSTDPKIYFVGNTHRDSIDTAMSDTSSNPVENKVIKKYVDTNFGKNKYQHNIAMRTGYGPYHYISLSIISEDSEPYIVDNVESKLIELLGSRGFTNTSNPYPCSGTYAYSSDTKRVIVGLCASSPTANNLQMIQYNPSNTYTDIIIDDTEYSFITGDTAGRISGNVNVVHSIVDNVIQI